MNKLAMLAALSAISATASAQSNVTLFGILDVNARYVENGDKSVSSLSSNGINTSRFGVRGTEDVGSGAKVGFWLESGLNVDNGTQSDATRFWNRRSTVSLISDTGGEIRLGRDYTPTYLGYTDYDPFGDNGLAASSKFDSSLGTARDTGTRADNQFIYLTPSGIGGFYARLALATGEGTVGKKYYGGRVGWGSGPIDVSVSYGQTDVAPTLGDDTFETFDVGASYDFGVVKLMGYYTKSTFAQQKIETYSLGAIMPIGPGQLKAAYTHANAGGSNAAGVNVDANDADQFAIGYIYNLSKRTALYSTIAYVNNKGLGTFAVATPPALPAGESSKGIEFGVRHSF